MGHFSLRKVCSALHTWTACNQSVCREPPLSPIPRIGRYPVAEQKLSESRLLQKDYREIVTIDIGKMKSVLCELLRGNTHYRWRIR